jgi:hypothetical protein
MFTLTDELIENTISNTSGFIVATVAEQTGLSTKEVSERFLTSRTFALLRDKKTGYYWDSIAELMDMFMRELKESR